jgi:hypothetical protein
MSIELLAPTTKSAGAKDLIKIQVWRLKSGNGIALYVKSAIVEDFIRANTLNPESVDSTTKSNFMTSANSGWSGHLGYKLAAKEELKALNAWGQSLVTGNTANLSFLTAKGLKDGITFEFEGMYSQTTVERFLMDVKKQVKSIWNDFIKEKNWTLTAELREIE